ncbi:hypothetical protein BC332_12446 [Capsicum chinense]|nr:hypothetical protein BC332_12446 [Capsicum chinense]
MYVELEDDLAELAHASMGKMEVEHKVAHYTLDMEVGEWDIMDFGKDFVELGHKLGFEPMGDAHLNGLIPPGIGNMSGLIILVFEHNNLTGNILPEIGKLRRLQGLLIRNSKLRGHIAEAVCHLSNLVKLDMDRNELTGVIPECLGNLSMMQHLYLGCNKFSSKLPLSLWKMKCLLFINASQNSIEGEIPENIGELKAIVDLDLSGEIPADGVFANFTLQSFLGNKDLSGMHILEIPACPIDMSTMAATNLDATFDRINDDIEEMKWSDILGEGRDIIGLGHWLILPFDPGTILGPLWPNIETRDSNLSVESLVLDSSLETVDAWEIEVPLVPSVSGLQKGPRILKISGLIWSVFHVLLVCRVSPINNIGQQSKSKEFVLKIVISEVTFSFLIFLLVSILIMKWLKKHKSKYVEKVPEIGTYQLISYHEIQRATNNFDGSNLIGEGSSGFVYKGTLSSGTVVAIKVLNLENEQVCKRFDTECEDMRNVRHRNLVPVITTCSSEYISAFVLQYMSNGRLENWLYGEDFHLNLLQSVTAMLDAAMAIEYLHHGNDTPIVHCDLKTTNILLDEDLVAHVCDFGISKILAISKSMVHTETFGTMMDVIEFNLFPEEEQITSKSEICIASMVELALDCTIEMPESRIPMKDVFKRLNKIKNSFLET